MARTGDFVSRWNADPLGAATENRRPQTLQGRRRLSAARPLEGRRRGALRSRRIPPALPPRLPARCELHKAAHVFGGDLLEQGGAQMICIKGAEVFVEISKSGEKGNDLDPGGRGAFR